MSNSYTEGGVLIGDLDAGTIELIEAVVAATADASGSAYPDNPELGKAWLLISMHDNAAEIAAFILRYSSEEERYNAPSIAKDYAGGTEVFVYEDESTDIDGMVDFVLGLAKVLSLKQKVFTLQWASYDQSGVPNNFGGGACVFTQAESFFMSSYNFANNMEMMLSPDGNGGSTMCPHCKTVGQVTGGFIEAHQFKASQESSCLACGATWTFVYPLSHATDVKPGEAQEV